MLGVQIVTGIVLAMHYTPHTDLAFRSVEEFKAQERAIVMGRFGTDLYDGIARPLP